MPFDYSRTDDPRDFSELIPHNTIVTTQMRIRPGNAGPDGLYKRTAKGDAEGLDSEFVVLDGPYVKKKFWDFFLLAGTTDGQKEMVVTNRGRLKKILESARGIKKGDTSAENLAKYQAEDKNWHPIEQPVPFNGGGAGAAAATPDSAPAGTTPITPPKWAS